MTEQIRRFEAAALPHLNAAYNLARWLVRDEHIAQDMVQEAFLRALKYYDSLRGSDMRPWLLGIVRNTCYTWLQSNKRGEEAVEFDEERDSGAYEIAFNRAENNPEALLSHKQESARVTLAIENLPPPFREVLVLRELEDLSYEEIAVVMSIPAGTVMSRLARARAMLRASLQRSPERGRINMDPHEDTEIAALIKSQAKYHEAPPHLRDRISAALKEAKPAEAKPIKSRWSAWQQGWGWGVAFAAGVILSITVTFFYGTPGQQDRLTAQVIDGHVRSLMVTHLADVTSSDQHTVKPWFSGKLDFSPPVQDLTAQGFPLMGGRLDYIDERPVAALVYQHRLHTINVFVWPVRDDAQTLPDSASRRGINVTAWKASGMQFWAVSDLNVKDLQGFGQMLRAQSKL